MHLAEFLRHAAKECKNTCMSLDVDAESQRVELILDTSIPTYSEWIHGEGGDICLLRCQETDRVVGCALPLIDEKLAVHHSGPLRVNEGFRLDEVS